MKTMVLDELRFLRRQLTVIIDALEQEPPDLLTARTRMAVVVAASRYLKDINAELADPDAMSVVSK